MPFDFTGKKILITGAGRGIGRELAKAISKNGGEVYALSVTKENLDSLAKESERIHPVLANLGNWDETRAAVEKLEAMDGVVNNAGVSYPWESSLDVSKELLDKTLNINLMAAINIIQVTGKKMVAAGKGGSIVNISRYNLQLLCTKVQEISVHSLLCVKILVTVGSRYLELQGTL